MYGRNPRGGREKNCVCQNDNGKNPPHKSVKRLVDARNSLKLCAQAFF